MEKLSGVIFDMDGLILDTESIYCKNNIKTAAEVGIKNYGLAEYKTEIGISEEHSMEKYLKDYAYLSKEAIETFFTKSRERSWKELTEVGAPLKKGIVELLTYLKENNIPCVVASSNTRVAIDQLISKAGLKDFFIDTISGDDVTHAKPHPEIVEVAVSKLGTKPEETMMLEDSLNGIRASYAAGVPVIMVPDLLEPDAEAIEKSYRIKNDLLEVLAFIKEI